MKNIWLPLKRLSTPLAALAILSSIMLQWFDMGKWAWWLAIGAAAIQAVSLSLPSAGYAAWLCLTLFLAYHAPEYHFLKTLPPFYALGILVFFWTALALVPIPMASLLNRRFNFWRSP